jgi:hypothetical protein
MKALWSFTLAAALAAAFMLGRASGAEPAYAAPAATPGPTRAQVGEMLTELRLMRRKNDMLYQALTGYTTHVRRT